MNFKKAARQAIAKFFSDIISKYSHTPKILFSTINSIINPRTSNEAEPSADICERFLSFFVEKIDGFRSSLIPSYSNTLLECPVNTVKFNSFQPVSFFDLRNLVMQVKSTTSPQDVVPSDIIKGSFDIIGSSIQTIISSCLVSGTVPAFLKYAVVHPLLKKPNVDVKCLNNYRPISKLPFLSKVMEKVVQSQLLFKFDYDF